MRQDPTGLFGPEFSKSFSQARMFCTKDGGGKECGIDRAGPADGECADRDAAGHLRDREERIEPLEGFRFDRNTEDREN